MNYFKVANENGQWKMYDPGGAEFYSLGVDCVTLVDVDLANCSSVYRDGARWFPDWSDAKLKDIAGLGFNTLGAWHHPYYWGNGYPKAVELGVSRLAQKVNTVWGNGFPDVFDPSFKTSIHKACIDHIVSRRFLLQDEGLIGYYTDNEIHWWGSGGYWGDNEQAEAGGNTAYIVDDYVNLPAEAAGKKRWVQFLEEKYGSVESLNETWGSEYLSFGDLLTLQRYRAQPDAINADKTGFLRLIARTYFKLTTSIIKMYDPNRLILGCRYVGNSTPDAVLEESRGYVDVDSFNFYAMDFPSDYMRHAYRITWRPMMLTEFSFSAGSSAGFTHSNNGSRNVIVRNQARRGEEYAKFIRTARQLPFMLGTHWFALFDYGRNIHGLIGNYGIYDMQDRRYDELAEAMKAAHSER